MILVSVIAADFTEEYDFTSIPTFTPTRREIPTAEEAAKEDPHGLGSQDEDDDHVSSILPNFLKGKLGNH